MRWGFREVFSREPAPEEIDQLVVFAARQPRRLAEGFLFLNPGEVVTGQPAIARDLPPGMTPTDLAVATALARVLLTTDEAITKE